MKVMCYVIGIIFVVMISGCGQNADEIASLKKDLRTIEREIADIPLMQEEISDLEDDMKRIEAEVKSVASGENAIHETEEKQEDTAHESISEEKQDDTAHGASTEETGDEHHWGYENQGDWEMIAGNHQSPINIETTDVVEGKTLQTIVCEFDTKPGYIIDNGHSITIGAEGNRSIINGREFSLLQFHYHALSEHTINGNHAPLEVHFVHISEDGRLAVIGVMINEGGFNSEFDKIIKNIALEKQNDLNVSLDYSELIPDNKSYYHYLGSLTTPPLSENVEWYILKDSIEISTDQIDEFHDYYYNNNRDVQELNDRVINAYN